ncbi:hypothetical protein PZH41_25995, partial [Phocaeicola vulgatus]|nr:hypothetical protein [Phocaeicola vulgatus]
TGKQLIMLDGTDAITVMAKKSITLTNEAESVIVMDNKSIGLQADTIALEGRKSVTLLSGNECMVLSSEKSIISRPVYKKSGMLISHHFHKMSLKR